MEAAISDFVGGLVRECHDLADPWRHRRPLGEERALARLQCWSALARHLPSALTSSQMLPVSMDDCQKMAADGRALRLICGRHPTTPEQICQAIDIIYLAIAGPSDPVDAFASAGSRSACLDWAAHHMGPETDWARAAVSMLDFVSLSPLAAHNVQAGRLLAAALPFWAGLPLIHALDVETEGEDGFAHALTAGLDDDPGAWIAYALSKQWRALKRLPSLLDQARQVREHVQHMLQHSDADDSLLPVMAAELCALPVLLPTFQRDSGLDDGYVRTAAALLRVRGELWDLPAKDGGKVTLFPRALRLLPPLRP